MKTLFPALFVSHGAPTLILDDGPAHQFLKDLGKDLGKPEAILIISAHWETAVPMITGAAKLKTIHDFRGFPKELYEINYPVSGSAHLVRQAQQLLQGIGLEIQIDNNRGLDHGAWVPLSLMYPDADVPVVQLSMQSQLGPAYHFALGKALSALRQQGVLIIGAGSLTHNLRELDPRISAFPPDWVKDFSDWVNAAVYQGRISDLIDYRQQAPHAARNHPTEEHFLPFFVSLGVGGGKGNRLHSSYTYGVLAMDAYRFDGGL